ncbi:MAG: efflux RND transporter periplasmic adaptor subunit [Desulfobulbaceae bacterium]|nr:efflux RND transporter periplasmic adaptor subunit [Desulfobulbaceae bacterium]
MPADSKQQTGWRTAVLNSFFEDHVMIGYVNTTWRTRACGLLAVILLLLAGCSGGGKEKSKAADQQAKPAVPVTVAVASRKTVPVELAAIGNVEAFATVAIKSQITGEVQTVHFQEGQEVKKGDLLFTIDPRPYEAKLAEAQANLAKGLAELDNARKQVDRYGAVAQKGYVSEEQYDQVRTSAATLEAAILADRAAVESARLDLAYCTIRSPLDGFAGDLKADRGNLIKANADTFMVTINQVRPVNVSFALPERSLPEVKRYMQASPLPVRAAIPGEEGKSLTGKLAFVDNTVDPTTGTILLKATYANEDGRLWPGQFVNVVLELTSQPDVVVIPGQAVQTGQKGQYVYLVREDLTVAYRDVVTGLSADDEVVISQGLQPGDKVVTDGQLRLAPGTSVKIAGSSRQESGKESQ